MFFADSLGPSRDAANAEAIYKFVKDRLRGKKVVSEDELRKLINDCIQESGGVGGSLGGVKILKEQGFISAKGKDWELKR